MNARRDQSLSKTWSEVRVALKARKRILRDTLTVRVIPGRSGGRIKQKFLDFHELKSSLAKKIIKGLLHQIETHPNKKKNSELS